MVGESESMPSLEQLQKLVSIGAARPRKAAYGVSLHEQEKYFAIDSLDSIIVRGDDENLERVRHSMGVRMARRALEVWRLEYLDVYRVADQYEDIVKSVTKYEFEWSAHEVLMARRKTTLTTDKERQHERDLSDDILRFHVRDDAAAILAAEMAFDEVTGKDCSRLISDTTAYYEQVNAVNRQIVG
jgi:hypothetical protein